MNRTALQRIYRGLLLLVGMLAVSALIVIWIVLGAKNVSLAPDSANSDQLRIFVLGDQGSGNGRQWQVARNLERVAEQVQGANAVFLLGDNFYSHGVQSVDDFQWRYAFENVYRGRYLDGMPFYAVLGNHDAKGSIEAELQYSREHLGSNRWRMPARHYAMNFGQSAQCNGCPLLRVVFLDTTRSSSTMAEEADFMRHSFESVDARWRVAVGHYPVRNFGRHGELPVIVEQLLPELLNSQVDLYISGHDHTQQIIRLNGEPAYLISGTGGKKSTLIVTPSEHLIGYSEDNGFAMLEINDQQLDIAMYELDSIPVARHTLTPNALKPSNSLPAPYVAP